jgi:hypothetical protein
LSSEGVGLEFEFGGALAMLSFVGDGDAAFDMMF